MADTGNSRIRVVAAENGTLMCQSVTAGDIFTVAGNVALDRAGTVYIADSVNNRIRKVTASPPAVPPQLTGISPAPGPVGRTLILTGSGFGTVAGSVYFTPGAGSPVVAGPVADTWTGGGAQVVVPSALAGGTVSVAVYSGQTGLGRKALSFTVTAATPPAATAPQLTGISPALRPRGREPLPRPDTIHADKVSVSAPSCPSSLMSR